LGIWKEAECKTFQRTLECQICFNGQLCCHGVGHEISVLSHPKGRGETCHINA